MAEDNDLLEPSIDPKKRAIGIRKVSAVNEASTRSVMTVRGHTVITDEKKVRHRPDAAGNDPGLAQRLRRRHH